MTKLLIIAGPTGVGKTKFAVDAAHKFNGEIISADSRQVYRGMDIVTGKDKEQISASGIPVWLYDLVNPDENFSVSLWHQAADKAIADIHRRGKLPIIVGGTGLYIRSLTENLKNIHIPPDPVLRQQLSSLSIDELLSRLEQMNPISANSLNSSDRLNPRRLIRHLEIALYHKDQRPPLKLRGGLEGRYTIVLTAPLDILKQRISARVSSRLSQGAILELNHLITQYSSNLPAFTACGYRSLLISSDPDNWIRSEFQYARRQLTWFKKYCPENWIDTSLPGWEASSLKLIDNWYNST